MPQWRAWEPGAGRFVVFDTPSDGGIRMSSETVDSPAIIARLESNQGLPQAEKCELFRELFEGVVDWNETAYRGLGEGGCGSEPAVPGEPD